MRFLPKFLCVFEACSLNSRLIYHIICTATGSLQPPSGVVGAENSDRQRLEEPETTGNHEGRRRPAHPRSMVRPLGQPRPSSALCDHRQRADKGADSAVLLDGSPVWLDNH